MQISVLSEPGFLTDDTPKMDICFTRKWVLARTDCHIGTKVLPRDHLDYRQSLCDGTKQVLKVYPSIDGIY